MVDDIFKLGNSLNNLHNVLRKNERRKTNAGIAGLLLSFIPVIGGALSTGASASAEILLGMNQADLLEAGANAAKGTVNHFLSVDFSNFQSVGVLTSEHFMSSLDEPTRNRVVAAIERSEFRSVAQFRKEFAEAQKVMLELEEVTEIDGDEGVESELSNRFSLISIEGTAGIRDAAPELYAFCTRRFPRFEVAEKEVRRELLKHCNRRTARLDFKAFQAVFNLYEEKYGVAGSQDEAAKELEERFSEAVKGRSSIDVDSAMMILENLHTDSGDADVNEVSFTRTRDEWDDEEAEKLFEEQGNANGNITKGGFIRVGLRMLFKTS